MLWKSAGGVLAICVFVCACAHNVSQDKATGPDGKSKGAKEITLDNGEGKATGVVTYPGGDRVDWKAVTLPEKKVGQLDIKLTWSSPRPGLRLAFDVFDEWNFPINPAGKQKKSGRVRNQTIDNAKGKYFIRVYAPRRGDAGKYKLSVEFKESGAMGIDLTKVEIPEPPKLAAVPEAEVPCLEHDPKNAACMKECLPGAPPGWPGCAGKCPTPPDINNPSCWATMPCPKPADRKIKACKPRDFPKCPDVNNPDPENPNCDGATAPPVTARVIKTEVQGNTVLVTVAAGSDQGIQKSWKGVVLRGDSDAPMDGGEAEVIRVGKRDTLCKVHLTTDQVSANPRVKLTAPPKQ